MRFNAKPKMTFEEIMVRPDFILFLSVVFQGDTQIPERELKKILQTLAMGKSTQRILCRNGNGKEIGWFSSIVFVYRVYRKD